MGNFILALDPDPGRRAALQQRLAAAAGPLPGMKLEHASFSDGLVAWSSAAECSVVDHASGVDLVLGEAVDESVVGPVGAAALGATWDGARGDASRTFDGYFAALSFRAGAGATAGADVLGVFPVYHASLARSSVHVVATSPAWVALHPLFTSEIDLQGLAGILTTMHSVGGRTLLAGLRRLSPGRSLVLHPERPPREVRQYELPAHRGDVVDEGRQMSILDEALEDSLRRHAPAAEPAALLLSGGRDSRMLAGYANRAGVAARALTIGLPGDIDCQCAAAVAEHLGWRQDVVEVEPSRYPELARRQVTWELLSAGMNSPMMWGLSEEPVLPRSTRLITGYLADSIVGGSHMSWVHDEGTGKHTYDALFSRVNEFGFSPEAAAALIRDPEAGSAVDGALADLRRDYEEHDGPAEWGAWCFDLRYRQRFHVGGVAWRLSFGFRPVIPMLDRGVLEAVARMPIPALSGRRLQDRLIVRAFPHLARLPLDRSGLDTAPLLASTWQRARRHARWRLRRTALGRLRAPSRLGGRRSAPDAPERRFYYRVWDLDGPGWRGIRLAAEPGRDPLGRLLEADALNRLVPAPDQSMAPAHGDAVVLASKLKTLLGLMLWAGGDRGTAAREGS